MDRTYDYHKIPTGIRIVHALWVVFAFGTIISLLVFGWQ